MRTQNMDKLTHPRVQTAVPLAHSSLHGYGCGCTAEELQERNNFPSKAEEGLTHPRPSRREHVLIGIENTDIQAPKL